MDDVEKVAVEILGPYVGDIVAKMCVKSAADRLGKAPEHLDASDVPSLLATVRAFLDPVAPHETIDVLVSRIEGRLT